MSESEDSKGNSIRYWQVSPGRKKRGFWLEFKSAHIIAMGWDRLGDLRAYTSEEEIENL